MGLFQDYESAGVGISKHAPKKKGIRLFFDIIWRKLWQFMGINLLYDIFFVPLFLIFPVIAYTSTNIALPLVIILVLAFMIMIGPATAGMTKIMRMYLIEKHTFITRDFFKGFKGNFKKASIIGFIDCIVLLSVYSGLKVYPALAAQFNTKLMLVPMVFMCSISLVIMIMNYYIFLMLVATDLSLKNLIKNSFALAFVAMKKNLLAFFITAVISIIMLALFLLGGKMTALFFMLIPIFPAAFLCFVTCFNSYPVIQKYVINPYYTSIGKINPELVEDTSDEAPIFEDMGGKERPIEKRKKGRGRHIS